MIKTNTATATKAPEITYIKFPVTSSFIEAVAYNSKTQILTVQIQNQRSYAYQDVPKSVFLLLLAANNSGGSVGQVYNQQVKGRYQVKKD
jgi:hypothetical protein